jgi:phosphatidylethanolamine-binding protein (PEBP) family uncharacterized protein
VSPFLSVFLRFSLCVSPCLSGEQGPTGSGNVSFKLYAIKGRLGLPAGASKEEVIGAMKGKVLGKATLSAKAQ